MTRCTHVQELLSAAADGERFDSAELDAARSHCLECTACATFATGVAAMRHLDADEPPAPVLERLLDAVRAEYPAAAEAFEQAPGPSAPPASAAHMDAPAVPARTLAGARRLPAWAPWAAAAAAVVLVAGVITTQGVRFLMAPSPPTWEVGGAAAESTQQDDERAADQAAPVTPPVDSEAAPAAVGPAYIVFAGDAYVLTGPSELPATGASVGEVLTARDTEAPAVAHRAYRGAAPHTLLLESPDGSVLGFSAVTRTLRGTVYVLRSGPIGAFGQWPSLPDTIPAPASADGTPAFIAAGADDLGVTIFVRPGSDPSAGFAVAPLTAPDDPAAGNTGWTWWEPRR